MTNILLDNINCELEKGCKPNQKIALFYMNIGDKKYYYSYNLLEEGIEDIFNSYYLVDIKKAKRLLTEQMEG